MDLKRVYYDNDVELEALRWCARVIDFGQSLLAFSALNEMLNAYIILHDDYPDMFKREIKKYANMAERNGRRKEIEIKSVMAHKKFTDSYFDAIIDAAHDDITSIRQSIKETLIDSNYKNAELVSYVETARMLLEASIVHFKSIMREAKKKYWISRDFTNDFCEFRLDSVYYPWQKVCDIIYNDANDTIDLNKTYANDIVDKVLAKFANGDYIGECTDVANKENPDFLELEIKLSEQK